MTKIDRLGRKAEGVLDLYERLADADVRLLPLRDPEFDSCSAVGRFLPKLLAVVAELEAEQISERVAATAAHNAKEGYHAGARPSATSGSKGEGLIPDPASGGGRQADVCAEADGGKSQRSIARDLNSAGIKPQRSKRGWTQSAVGVVLRNPTYKGVLIHEGEEIAAKHEAIIEAEVWDRVAAERERNTRSREGGIRGPGRSPAGAHLFTRGLLKCGHCGFALTPRTDPGKKGGRQGRRREEYRCLGREQNGTKFCPQTPIPRAPLDAAAFEYFRTVGIDLEATRAQLEGAIQREREAITTALEEAEREELAAAEALSRVGDDYKRGAISAEDWQGFKPGAKERARGGDCEAPVKRASMPSRRRRPTRRAGPRRRTWSAEGRGDSSGRRRGTSPMRSGSTPSGWGSGEPSRSSWSDEPTCRPTRTRSRSRRSPTLTPRPDGATLAAGDDAEWVVLPIPLESAIEGLEASAVPVLQPAALTLADGAADDPQTTSGKGFAR